MPAKTREQVEHEWEVIRTKQDIQLFLRLARCAVMEERVKDPSVQIGPKMSAIAWLWDLSERYARGEDIAGLGRLP